MVAVLKYRQMPADRSVTESTTRRIRKLRRLSKSNNEHEAARAREEAERLMARHGLTDDDVAEDVIEGVDTEIDDYRMFVAGFAARFYECTVVSRSNGIGFKGLPNKVKLAKRFYQNALNEWRNAGMPPVAAWLYEEASRLWKFFWFDGFAAKMYERFGGRNPKAVAKPSPDGGGAATKSVVDEIRAAASALRSEMDLDWFHIESSRMGRAAADRMHLDLDIVDDDTRALPKNGLHPTEENETTARARQLEVD